MSQAWPTAEAPGEVPIWLANLELFLSAQPQGEDVASELAVLNYFAPLGSAWLDRTRITDDPTARASLTRALGWYGTWCDFTQLAMELPAKTFVVRGRNLLRSLEAVQ